MGNDLTLREKERFEDAHERGYIVDAYRRTRPRLSDAWWRTCEEDRRVFVRVDIIDGHANIVVDALPTGGLLPLKTLQCLDDLHERYFGRVKRFYGETQSTICGFPAEDGDILARTIVATFEKEKAE
jgi:hypothetical protein